MTDLAGTPPDGGHATGGPIPRPVLIGTQSHQDPVEMVIPLHEPRPVHAGEVMSVLLRYDGHRWHPVLPTGSAPAWRQRQVPARPPWWQRVDSVTMAAVFAVVAGLVASIVWFGVLPGIAMTALGLAAGAAIGRNLG